MRHDADDRCRVGVDGANVIPANIYLAYPRKRDKIAGSEFEQPKAGPEGAEYMDVFRNPGIEWYRALCARSQQVLAVPELKGPGSIIQEIEPGLLTSKRMSPAP